MAQRLDMYLNCYPAQYINCMTSDSEFVAFVNHAIQLALDLMAYPTIWAALSILLETQDVNASYVHFLIDQYLHNRVTPTTLSSKLLTYDKPIDPSEIPRISTCTDTITNDTNVPTKDDKYPWLDPEDKRRHMTDAEILRQKLNLEDSLLDEKGKEEFLTKTDYYCDVFSLRDEIGICQFIEVHLKLKDKTPFFVQPYPM